jgi:hypothetical protein
VPALDGRRMPGRCGVRRRNLPVQEHRGRGPAVRLIASRASRGCRGRRPRPCG